MEQNKIKLIAKIAVVQ